MAPELWYQDLVQYMWIITCFWIVHRETSPKLFGCTTSGSNPMVQPIWTPVNSCANEQVFDMVCAQLVCLAYWESQCNKLLGSGPVFKAVHQSDTLMHVLCYIYFLSNLHACVWFFQQFCFHWVKKVSAPESLNSTCSALRSTQNNSFSSVEFCSSNPQKPAI